MDWVLEGVEAWNRRRSARAFQPDVSGVNFLWIFLKSGKLDAYGRCNLAKIDFRGADLRGADLTGVCLSGAKLHNARLSGAIIGAADLSGAACAGADFAQADARRGHLPSPMRKAHFRFFGGLNLTKAYSLEQDQIDQLIGDTSSKVPEGMQRPDAWTDAV